MNGPYLGVICAELVYATELNEFLINTAKRTQRSNTLVSPPHGAEVPCRGPHDVPGVSEFLLVLDVAVCVKVAMQLAFVQLLNLLLSR